MALISISESAKLFKISYFAFFKRVGKSKYNYPQFIYKNGVKYIDKEQAIKRAQIELDFLEKNIPVTTASYLLFGDHYLLKKYLLNKQYTFLIPTSYCGTLYINKIMFNKFYSEFCDCKRLVPLSYIIGKLRLVFGCKYNLYSLAVEYGLMNCRFFIFTGANGRKYFNHNDAKKWLKNFTN